MEVVCSKCRWMGIGVALAILAGLAVGLPLFAADVGITSDSGNRGDTPSTTYDPSIINYTGFPNDTTLPEIVSITTNNGITLSPDGNTNFPAGYNAAPITLFVLFDEDMMTSSSNVYTPNGVSWGDTQFTCTGNSVTVDSQTLKYSTGSQRILELPLNGILSETGTCQLLLNRGNDQDGTIISTGTIRDVAHNPTPIALYTISSICTLNDSFSRSSDGIGCWSQQNAGNGSFSVSGGALNYSSSAGAVTGSSAPALRKTGVSMASNQTDITFSLTVSAVSGMQSGDGIGLRVTDVNGNYAILLVYNDGSNYRDYMIFSNGTTTSTKYLDSNPGVDPAYYYNAITNNTLMLHVADAGFAAYPYGRNTLNNLTTDPDGLIWAGATGKFGTSNLTVDIVGIRGSGGGTASAVLDSFSVTNASQ